jgi:mannose-6-phosphate isomerase-like protein (cupin superfamily)
VKAAFVEPPYKIADDYCARLLVAVVKGKMTVGKDNLDAGDVLVLGAPMQQEVKGTGLAVVASTPMAQPCVATARPAESRAIVRGKDTKKLTFAKGKMNAWLDVDKAKSPELYLGRLEGTAPVAEHDHPTSWEILASVDAAGTLVLGGKEQHVGPKQVVVVPMGAKHQWKPDAGSKLVAIQMYAPPGPEQRFLALDAGEKDGGAK